jgi:hypothetical protein
MDVKGHRHLVVAGLLGGLVVVAAEAATASAAAPPSSGPAPYVVVLRDDADVNSTAAKYQNGYGAIVSARFGSALKGFAASSLRQQSPPLRKILASPLPRRT